MKKFKKVMTLLLAGLMTGSCLAGAMLTTSAEETEYSERITDNVGGTYHGNYVVNYAGGGAMNYQTYINYEFTAFDFGLYTNSTDPQPFTYSLYKWDTSLEKTLEGEPLATQKYEDLVKGAATARLEFDAQPAGEYLFRVSNASGAVCVPFYTAVQNLKGTYYHGPNERGDAMPGLTVYTKDDSYIPGTMFSKTGESQPGGDPDLDVPAYADINVALGAPVTTYLDNCYQEYGNSVKNLTDGNRSSQFCSTIVKPATDGEFDWIMIDLKKEYTINQVNITPVYDGQLKRFYMFPRDYKVEISTDNKEWKTVAEVVDTDCAALVSITDNGQEVIHRFEAQDARYVRIYFTGVDKSVHNPPQWFVYLKELEVYYSTDDGEETPDDGPRKSANVLENRRANTPEEVSIGWTYGYRAKVNHAFNAFDYRMPTWTTTTGYCTLALYKWDTNYETTIAGEPIATKSFTNLQDYARNKIEFETQPAGEYLFYIYDTSYRSCGVYIHKTSGYTDAKGFSYVNEVEINDRTPDLQVYTPEEFEGDFFGTCEPQDMKFNDAEYTPIRDKTPTYDELMSNIIIEGGCAAQFEELYNQEYFNMMGAAHFDIAQILIEGSRNTTEALAKKSFELAYNAGMGVHIMDQTGLNTKTERELYNYIDKWRNIKGFGILWVIDEPRYPNEWTSTINLLHNYAPGSLLNINLHPYGAYDPYASGVYFDVFDDYCRLLENKEGMFLGFDNYPFSPKPGTLDEFSLFYCLNQCRLAGLENDIRTSFYPLSVGSNDYSYRKPSGSELRYHVNSGLAYGIKKIAYWTYGSSVFEHRDFYTTAIVDRYGYPTELYYAVSEVNRQTHAIGTTLVNLDALEVYHSGDSGFDKAYEAYDHIPADFFAKTDDYVILSLMKHKENGRNYLMIVNKDFTNAQEISITMSDVATLREISNESGEEINTTFENGVFTRTLEAGAAVLLALPEDKDYTKPETVVESDNLLANAYVSASNSYGQDNYYINRVNDGVTTTETASKGWKATSTKKLEWLKLDLGEVKGFDRLELYPATDSADAQFMPGKVTVLVSNDGEEWTTLLDGQDITVGDKSASISLGQGAGRYVRLEFEGLKKDGNKYTCILSEVELYNDSGVVPPVQDEETTTPDEGETTTPDGETTAPDSSAETTIPDGETTVAPDGETTVPETTVADSAIVDTEAGTAAGTNAPAGTTAAAASEGCKAVVGSMSAIALALVASAAAVVLKKKED